MTKEQEDLMFHLLVVTYMTTQSINTRGKMPKDIDEAYKVWMDQWKEAGK